jgi:crotonobetaine/carnitine-CoA ligase
MTDAMGDRTVVELLDDLAAEPPLGRGVAFESAGGTVTELSYAELAARSTRLAGRLANHGVRRGDRVLVQLPNGPDVVITWFALMRLGAIFVPANPANTVRELAHMIGLAGIERAVATEAAREPFAAASNGRITADDVYAVDTGSHAVEHVDEAPALSGEGVGDPRLHGDDIVELVFTSGTTSAPKAAMITHANCRFSGMQKAAAMELTERDCVLSALPFFHVNAQSAFLAALTVGARFVLLESYSAHRLCGQLRAHGATVTSFVSTQVRTLLRQPEDAAQGDHAVRRAWFALDVDEGERLEFARRFGIRLLNGYGLTEAFTSVCQTPLRGRHRWPSVGLPLLGRTVRILGPDGLEVPVGQVGEIAVGGTPGRTLMAGYWNDPDATAAALVDGELRTGDFGRLDDAGFLHFVGRKTDLIKRAGENIAAAEVEVVLRAHRDVVDVAVVGVPDPIRDEAVMAFVVLGPGADAALESVVEHARRELAPFKVPTCWEVVSELPRTSIGKVHKASLRELAAGAARTDR